MKSRSLLISICVILSSQTVVDAADLQLPKPADMFAVGFQPQPVGSTPYFDEASFRAIYPFLKPAKVTIAVGAKRVWQAGVIVTKDKKVFFWSTCARSFIAVDVGGERHYFAPEAQVFVQ